jgi:hypothetical protein
VKQGFTVTVRRRGEVTRERHEKRGDALEAMETLGRELEREADGHPEGGGVIRKIEPAKQVVARIELSGPTGCEPASTSVATAPARPSPAACGASSWSSAVASRPTRRSGGW